MHMYNILKCIKYYENIDLKLTLNRSLLNLDLFSHLKHVLHFHFRQFYVRQFHAWTF